MDSLCAVTGKEHEKEYFETRGGEVWEKCRHCGEHFFAFYQDCGCGR